jgi:hypothetical protein
MKREDMIRMAHESGWQYAHGDSGYEPLWAFAALVASAEREAILDLVDGYAKNNTDLAEAIRARGQA